MPIRKPKLLILGHARHGKDTVSEMLRDSYGYSFVSSSYFLAEEVLFPLLKDKYGYATAGECFADRANHRAEWFNAIRDYNRLDATTLGRAIFKVHDLYCGLRNQTEFHAMRNTKVFDLAIWVDASDRKEPESRASCTVEPWMADYVLDNNGSLEDLEFNLGQLYTNRIQPLETED
jgi:dephospho-CoA kinase